MSNDWLLTLKEGDLFESNALLGGIDDEKIAWQVLEVVDGVALSGEPQHRITVHGYAHDVFLIAGTVKISNGNAEWSFNAQTTG